MIIGMFQIIVSVLLIQGFIHAEYNPRTVIIYCHDVTINMGYAWNFQTMPDPGIEPTPQLLIYKAKFSVTTSKLDKIWTMVLYSDHSSY